MHEQFLHYLWKHKLYTSINLTTECNQMVEVIHPGDYNTNAGPDFFNAKIKLNDILWVGNVEVHSKASEWQLHQHNVDEAYNNVILHVVEDADERTVNAQGKDVPIIKLQYRASLGHTYTELTNSPVEIACSSHLKNVSEFEMTLWMQRLLVERLEQKTEEILLIRNKTVNHWDEVFYILLFRSFGQGINGLPFELLAKSIPLITLLKYCDNISMVEALLFGQSGMLSDDKVKDDYYLSLVKNYQYLQNKHKFTPIDKSLWKFLRLRPVNFPTIRLAQLAQLLVKLRACFGKLIEAEQLCDIEIYTTVEASSYWENHYVFGKESRKISKPLSSVFKRGIVLNAIVPYLIAYAKGNGNEAYQEMAIKWLNTLKPETNSILNQWKKHGIGIKNAADSQALIFLFNYYCKSKRCLHCRIGHHVLATKNNCE